MTTKEAKASLKAARDEIRSKNYEKAAEQCRNVLKWEPMNYNALVMLGAAAQELGDYASAKEALKRAIDGQPDQVTAWQGLRALYETVFREKRKDLYDAEDHVKAGLKLVGLFKAGGDGSKACDAAVRLSEIYAQQENRREAIKVNVNVKSKDFVSS
jgi:superkiller protein 3